MVQDVNDETTLTTIERIEGFEEKYPAIAILGGPSMGQQILLTEGESIWGRSRDATVLIEDESISRYQFKITVRDNIATIEDLNSKNGTYVNGIRIKQHTLQANDKIQISPITVLRFSYVDFMDTDLHRRIYEMALYDPLSGAHTKRYFLDRIKHEFSHALRKHQPLSLILFDLDHFKKINDVYGHLAGDLVLQEVAKITLQLKRQEDVFARYGGEEFAVLMRDSTENEAQLLAERIRTSVEAKTIAFEKHKISAALSLGIACFDGRLGFKDYEQLFQAADQALYYSKAQGRNQVTLWSQLKA